MAPFAIKLVNYSSHSESLKYVSTIFYVLKIDNSLLLKENVVDFGILPNVQILTVRRIIDQFGHKSSVKCGLKTFIRFIPPDGLF